MMLCRIAHIRGKLQAAFASPPMCFNDYEEK